MSAAAASAYVPNADGSADAMLDALRSQEDYVRRETLSVELRIGEPPPPGAYAEEREADGAALLVGIARA